MLIGLESSFEVQHINHVPACTNLLHFGEIELKREYLFPDSFSEFMSAPKPRFRSLTS